MKHLFVAGTAAIAALILSVILIVPPKPDPVGEDRRSPPTRSVASEYTIDKPTLGARSLFVENAGQTGKEVGFHLDAFDHTLLFRPDRVEFRKTHIEGVETLFLQFEGSQEGVRLEGVSPQVTKVNLYQGGDRSRWVKGAATYSAIRYLELYPGIDLHMTAGDNHLKSEFSLEPGADPDLIRLRYAGAEWLSIGADGELIVQTSIGRLVESAPVVYQDTPSGRMPVEAAYLTIDDQTVGFDIGNFEPSLPLVIDPEIVYRITLETVDPQEDMNIIGAGVKPNGNLVITGLSSSPDIKDAPPPLNPSTGFDIYVAEIDTVEDALAWITFIGGSNIDAANDLAVDSDGNIYIVGQTFGSGGVGTFPVVNAFQSDYGGGVREGIVVKFDPDGGVIFATYLGGNDNDTPVSLALGPENEIVIGGDTESPDFPLQNAIQDEHTGDRDFFLTTLTSDGQLVFSTFLGGSDRDSFFDLELARDGTVWATGEARSADFPLVEPIDGTFDGALDAVVLSVTGVLDGVEPELTFSTYFGGESLERGSGLTLDGSAVVVVGRTNSVSLPTVNAVQPEFGGNVDGFAVAFDSSRQILYSTYNGGPAFDEFIAVEAIGNGCSYAVGPSDTLGVGRSFCLDGTAEDEEELADFSPFTMTTWYEDAESITFFVGGAEERDPGFWPAGKRAGTGNREAEGLGFEKEKLLNPADLSITKVGPDTVGLGLTTEYAITVRNNSSERVRDIRIIDILPDGTTLHGDTNGDECWEESDTAVECAIDELGPGEEKTVFIIVTVERLGDFVNVALVEADNPDPDTTDNYAFLSQRAIPQASLSIDVSSEDGTLGQPLPIAARVVVTNTSDSEIAYGLSLLVDFAQIMLRGPHRLLEESECSRVQIERALFCRRASLAPREEWILNLDIIATEAKGSNLRGQVWAWNAEREFDYDEFTVALGNGQFQWRHESSEARKSGADMIDIYVNDSLIVDDLASGAASQTIELTLDSTQRHIDWVDGSEPDNKNPLASFGLDLISLEDSVPRVTQAVLLTLLSVPDSLAQIVSRDHKSEADDPGLVDLRLTNGSGQFVSVAIRAQEPGRPILADLGGGVGPAESSGYGALPPQPVLIDVVTDAGGVETFALDLTDKAGAAVVALLKEGSANKGGLAAGFALSTFDAAGNELVNRVVTSTEARDGVPIRYELHAAYPNPFNPSTTMQIDLPERTKVTIEVFDIMGRLVETLVDAEQPAGRFTVVWDMRGASGKSRREISSGTYLVRMRAGAFERSRKVVLLR